MPGELEKIGIVVAKSTVEKYMIQERRPPSPTWWAFLKNQARELVSIDFFVVPTVRFEVLFASSAASDATAQPRVPPTGLGA